MNDAFYNNIKMTQQFGRRVSAVCRNLLPPCWWMSRQEV